MNESEVREALYGAHTRSGTVSMFRPCPTVYAVTSGVRSFSFHTVDVWLDYVGEIRWPFEREHSVKVNPEYPPDLMFRLMREGFPMRDAMAILRVWTRPEVESILRRIEIGYA